MRSAEDRSDNIMATVIVADRFAGHIAHLVTKQSKAGIAQRSNEQSIAALGGDGFSNDGSLKDAIAARWMLVGDHAAVDAGVFAGAGAGEDPANAVAIFRQQGL